MSRKRTIQLIPNAADSQVSAVAAGIWLTLEVPVWVRGAGYETLGYAKQLMEAYGLRPKQRVPVPEQIHAINRQRGDVLAPVIKAMEWLLTKGTWLPTILPFNEGPMPGFHQELHEYNRMVLMQYDPGEEAPEGRPGNDVLRVCTDAFPTPGTEETLETHSAIFSPELLNSKEHHGGLLDVAKALKRRLDNNNRYVHIDRGTYAKGLWVRHPGSMFKREYAGQAELISEGEELNRRMLVNARDCVDRLAWLKHYRNRVITVRNTTEIFPKIEIRYEDFPQSVRENDPYVFDHPW